MTIHITPSGKAVLPFHGALAALFDHERKTVAGVDYMALTHGVPEVIMGRRFGLDMPSTVARYNWGSAPFKPFEVQSKTVEFLVTNQRGYVLNGMGTGKTLSALWAFDHLRQEGYAQKMLIVAPASTLYSTWAKEIFNSLPHLRYEVLDGTKARRLKRLANMEADCYIINHDGVGVVHEALVARPDIDVLCIDELAVYRNARAVRTKLMAKFASTKQWVWGMTGSPASMGPISVYGQCQIITPWSVPKYFGHFRRTVQHKITQFKWDDNPDALERALEVMSPSVRFSLDDVVELPQLVMQTVDVPMSNKQKTVYKAMHEAAAAMVDSGAITAANAGAALSKLLQISAGWVYNSNHEVVELDGGARLDACVDAITAAGNKTIVFANFKHVAAGIAKRLEEEGIDFALVDGSVPISKRTDIFNAFQNTSQYRVIVASPTCMAHGLTLTAADTIIWWGPTLSLETFDQANARIRRIGQKHKQLVLMLCSSPAERKMYRNLENRGATQSKMLDMFRDRTALAA